MAESGKACPYDSANIFSKILFWWLNPFFALGSKHQITTDNICDVSKHDESLLLETQLERFWKVEIQKHAEGGKAKLLFAVFRAFKWQCILPGILLFVVEALKVAQPVLIGLLVSYLNDEDDSVGTSGAYGVGAGLGLSGVLLVCLNPTAFFLLQHVSMRMKVAVGALIYRKVLTLSAEAFQYTSAGQIVNHLSTDIEKFNEAMGTLHYFWISPLSIGVVIYLIYRQVGVAAFWGLLIIVLIVPLQSGLAALFGKLRYRMAAIADQRIQFMTETVMGMRVIKMHCWEFPFEDVIMGLRRSETSLLRLIGFLKSLLQGLETTLTRLALLALVLGLLAKEGLISSSDAYTCLAFLYVASDVVLRFPVQTVQQLKDLLGSAQLVQNFLLLDEKKDQIKDLRPVRSIHRYNDSDVDWAIDIDHMTARWPIVYVEGARRFQRKRRSRSSTSSMKSLLHESDSEHAFSLKYMSLQIKKHELLAVVGVVGSGKSSLLMSLIGELPFDIGQISVNGKVSYCGQVPWISGGTVRDNILLGKDYVAHYYQSVVNACGLRRDFELFPAGDMTFVGERGLQLSGGQKARISLARCVYHEADIFLLDDPLSAVDAGVGEHIFERCIKDLLKDKTVVLVTHQLQYLKRCDRIVVLRDGSIHDVGNYDELKERGMDMKALIASDNAKQVSEATLEAEEEEKQIMLESKLIEAGKCQEEEDIATGSVGLRVYWDYFTAGLGHFVLPLLIPLWFGAPALLCFSDWMLTKWVGEQAKRPDSTVSPGVTLEPKQLSDPLSWDNMPESLQLYIIGLMACLGVYMLFSFIYLQIAATAGQRLHDKMLDSIMNSIGRFFDTHPVGQVLNRFSRDLSIIDDILAIIGYVVSVKTVQFLGFITVTLIVNPWLLIALVPILIVVLLVRIYAVRTLRQVKRLEAQARSPLFSHVSDTVLGLETIRALGKRDQFLKEFDLRQNRHTSTWFLYISSYRWMSIRMLMAVVIYMIVIIFVSLQLKDSLDGNLLALSLIYCIFMGEPFEFYMRITADLETYMTSVERVLGYCKLECEASKQSDKPVSPDWPTRGAITFSKTNLKYSSDGPFVLKQIDCHIKGKEKIGIVGRTGSGKSSLIAALFRLAEPTGLIFIDGNDISKLGLYDLRKKMSVIPQDPYLFSHTLRWNLDPLEEFSDERLWKALEQVQLKDKVDQMANKLYTEMKEGGQNLSVGQRQLICLARAILKSNRILVLDEATANVDEDTDAIIQKTIRSRFRESTVLTIAHRLYTIMDSDRIMVLADGQLKEFDTPYQLLQDQDGYFTQLVNSLGKNQAKQLRALADLSQHKRTSASLQHQRAVLLASEQLAQSMEDLRQGQAALNWNRFNMNISTDSLDKIEPDSSVETHKKSLGPSQKIIRRRSPGRGKRPTEEGIEEGGEGLVSYDSPPRSIKIVNRKQTPQGANTEDKDESSGDSIETNRRRYRPRQEGYNQSPKSDRANSSPSSPRHFVEHEDTDVQYRRQERGDRWMNRHKKSDVPASQDQIEHSRQHNPSHRKYGAERNSSSASDQPLLQEIHKGDPRLSSSNMRVLRGPYTPLTQKEDEEKEQFV